MLHKNTIHICRKWLNSSNFDRKDLQDLETQQMYVTLSFDPDPCMFFIETLCENDSENVHFFKKNTKKSYKNHQNPGKTFFLEKYFIYKRPIQLKLVRNLPYMLLTTKSRLKVIFLQICCHH